jgi:hypothetical protein
VRRIALILLALAGCAEPLPPEFVSKEHKFRVRFGGVPTAFDRPDNGIPSKLYTVTSPDGAYTVRAYDLPLSAEQATAATGKLLDEAKSDLIRSVGGTETESASVVLAGRYAGRAFTATATTPERGLLRGRVYLAGTRLYKVSVFGTRDFAEAPAAGMFLESFAVLE